MLRRPFRCLFYKLHVCSFNIYIVVLIAWKGIEILSLVLKQFWKIFKKNFEMKSPFRNIQSLKIVIWFKKSPLQTLFLTKFSKRDFCNFSNIATIKVFIKRLPTVFRMSYWIFDRLLLFYFDLGANLEMKLLFNSFIIAWEVPESVFSII